jgi:hypothetical protein
MNRIHIAYRIREQLDKFLGIFSPHFSKPDMKFLGQMVYGLQAHQDVKLSQIARALNEDVTLKKTEERLSRHLKKDGMGQKINEQIARHAAPRIKADTLIVIDPTDVRKNYAKKMPYLATVRDGSSGELASGYCVAVACDSKCRRVLPLHQRLWSAKAPDFESENAQILQVIDTIREPTHGRGIYVMDRGGDRIKLLNPLLDRKLRFIVRCVGDRDLHFGNTVKSARELGKNCPVHFTDTVIKEGLETQKSLTLRYGFRPVKLPERSEQLYLVVVHGFGEEPMLLLTNVALQDSRKSVWAIVTGYLCRWLIEETIRFIKQSYRLEDIRVLKYERLQNMMALVLAAAYFAAVWLGESLKLAVMTTRIKQAARHFFTVPDFHYYALADGIATLLSRLTHWKSPPQSKTDPKLNTQMAWSFADA